MKGWENGCFEWKNSRQCIYEKKFQRHLLYFVHLNLHVQYHSNIYKYIIKLYCEDIGLTHKRDSYFVQNDDIKANKAIHNTHILYVYVLGI